MSSLLYTPETVSKRENEGKQGFGHNLVKQNSEKGTAAHLGA